MLGDLSKKNKSYRNIVYHLHVESKKRSTLVNVTEKKWTSREQTSGCQWGEGRGEGQGRLRGQELYTVMYNISYKEIQTTV